MEELAKPQKKSSLYDFLEENHKLFSVMGVFAALSLFSKSYFGSIPGVVISYLFLTGFVILLLELWTRFKKDTSAEQLIFWFQGCLFLIGLSVVLYWLLGLRLADKDMFYQVVSLSLAIILFSLTLRVIKERGYLDTEFSQWLHKYWLLRFLLLILAGLIVWGVWIVIHSFAEPVFEPVFNFLWVMKNAVISAK
jgi:hypothetical protein